MSRLYRSVIGMGAALVTVTLLSAPAQAKKYVYSPIVHEGEKELEYYVDWHEKPDGTEVVGHELEYVNVFGPKDKLALYGVWEDTDGSGNDTEFKKWKVEWIHQLFEQGERSWDTGIYFEYQVQADTTSGADKVEIKPLFMKEFGPTHLLLNGILEKEIGQNAGGGTELGYAAQFLWRMSEAFQPGVEAFGAFGEMGNLTRDYQIVGPVAKIKLGKRIGWQVGALFGINSNSEDVRVKSNLAYEWY